MSSSDHRAEAERKLALVDDDSIAPLLEALVHATLAGPPVRTIEIVADDTAQRELDELREAVRALLDGLNRHPAVFGREVLPTERERLRKLIGDAR